MGLFCFPFPHHGVVGFPEGLRSGGGPFPHIWLKSPNEIQKGSITASMAFVTVVTVFATVWMRFATVWMAFAISFVLPPTAQAHPSAFTDLLGADPCLQSPSLSLPAVLLMSMGCSRCNLEGTFEPGHLNNLPSWTELKQAAGPSLPCLLLFLLGSLGR